MACSVFSLVVFLSSCIPRGGGGVGIDCVCARLCCVCTPLTACACLWLASVMSFVIWPRWCASAILWFALPLCVCVCACIYLFACLRVALWLPLPGQYFYFQEVVPVLAAKHCIMQANAELHQSVLAKQKKRFGEEIARLQVTSFHMTSMFCPTLSNTQQFICHIHYHLNEFLTLMSYVIFKNWTDIRHTCLEVPHQNQKTYSWSKCFPLLWLCVQHAAELVKTVASRYDEYVSVKDLSDKINRALTAAKKDNDFIYHDRVPEIKDLEHIAKAALVRATTITPPLSQKFTGETQRHSIAVMWCGVWSWANSCHQSILFV